MSQKLSIQLKAAILLLVFSLNTVVGFACALGMDMGFNTSHHDDKGNATEVKEIHVHEDGAIHHHGSSSDNEPADQHESGVAQNHHHDESLPAKQAQDGKSMAGKDDSGCCSDEVLKFQSIDKNLNQTNNSGVDIPVFVAMLSSFFGVDLTSIVKDVPPKFKARFYYPPPPDIRIAIQRFQI